MNTNTPRTEPEATADSTMQAATSRRAFLKAAGLASLGAMTAGDLLAAEQGTPDAKSGGEAGGQSVERPEEVWKPVSDRRIRVGIAGYGVCQWGAMFGFQDHPNVEVVAVTDLIPERCDGLARACRCDTKHPSLEEMVKDDRIEAIFVATDAPSHARHCIEVLKHGKHVATAVPAVWGSLDDAHELHETVKKSGRKYMMFETSAFHPDLYAMRQIYHAGGFGSIVYAEGEYFHFSPEPIPSYKGWRVGLPPQWYPTHSNAYYVAVTGGSFTEVSCLGIPSVIHHLLPANNRYRNPFGTEIALLRTSEGGTARMGVSWDTPGYDGEMGRVRGQRGSYYRTFVGLARNKARTDCPPLPPGVAPGGHGGSHGHLMNEFVTAILEDRQPLVNIAWALNMTVAGIVAHQSALRGGEWLKIPQFKP